MLGGLTVHLEAAALVFMCKPVFGDTDKCKPSPPAAYTRSALELGPK